MSKPTVLLLAFCCAATQLAVAGDSVLSELSAEQTGHMETLNKALEATGKARLKAEVLFRDYASAENACSWARAQGHEALSTPHGSGEVFKCRLSLVVEALDDPQALALFETYDDLRAFHGGYAGTWTAKPDLIDPDCSDCSSTSMAELLQLIETGAYKDRGPDIDLEFGSHYFRGYLTDGSTLRLHLCGVAETMSVVRNAAAAELARRGPGPIYFEGSGIYSETVRHGATKKQFEISRVHTYSVGELDGCVLDERRVIKRE